MSRARLKALRMTGFKSFAEKTLVEFGPGISAIIGPNGSGKSNLADALRWSLGEQGRTLRTRRAEDLIFAGSSTRKAQGMADVTLVIDNADRLLPVDFAELELGRRLFRSGENEYLLNRQRIRLRDLVDLLDEANLADNAFLFIGQGMVDQALALRPEERRPLFEEAAGIRKHERRRRAAEAELAEAEGNLERVRDLLGELRPQAKRLAAQAEQQARRRDAARELADALVAVARERLGGAEREIGTLDARLADARAATDAALAALRGAEEEAEAIARALAERAEAERGARAALDVARGRLVEERLAGSRLAGDGEALERDRERLLGEQRALAARLEAAGRDLALPLSAADEAAEEALREVDGAIAEVRRSIAELREAGRDDAERLRMARVEREGRRAAAAQAARRASEAAARATDATATAGTAAQRAEAAAMRRTETERAAAEATAEEERAERAAETAREGLTTAEASLRDARTREAEARAALAALDARRGALDALIGAGRSDGAVTRIRSAGGRALMTGLEVDPPLRRAVEAVLGDLLRSHVVASAAIPALADLGGSLVLAEAPGGRGARDGSGPGRSASRIGALVAESGGGLLATALRRDPDGLGARLLATAAWVPELTDALALHAAGEIPTGWRVATRDGGLVTDDGVVRLPAESSLLERRAERTELDGRREAAEAAVAAGAAAVADGARSVDGARRASEEARAALEGARRARRVADEADRSAARLAETTARESAWAARELERLAALVESTVAERDALDAEVRRLEAADRPDGTESESRVAAEIAAREAGLRAQEEERDRRREAVRRSRERVEADRERRRRAELVTALDGARSGEIDRELGRLAGAEADLAVRRESHASALAAGRAEEERAAAALAAIESTGADDRTRLLGVERRAGEAREELRVAEGRTRSAEVRLLELRVQLDAAREGLLVELAAIGPDGVAALRAVAPAAPEADAAAAPASDEDRVAALEDALAAALAAWRDGEGAYAEPAPSPGRLAALRRRYHELGAGNPYAAEELAELGTRLDALDAQREDLEEAMRGTRELIARLETLISEQFRTTFSALEGAFARRFEQLFDGGEARLSLTQPEDLGATGVEIVARPPGKRRQPLAMLSGGERALTAVALLLAMLEVRPVPFCVLDEVDAALDEANVGRFSSALRTLSEEIQFVVITHNRGTIEAADALYGVTVGDDAVSRVISLRLGDRAASAAEVAQALEEAT